MTGITSDRDDPRLTHGVDHEPIGQAEVYLVLSDEERAKGFVRPVRRSYVHTGGCGAVTTMGLAIAETYAANSGYYGATYCVGCSIYEESRPPTGLDTGVPPRDAYDSTPMRQESTR